MSNDLLDVLMRGVVVASAAIMLVLMLRGVLRTAFGARIAYASWLLVPIVVMAANLPARRLLIDEPAGYGAESGAIVLSAVNAAAPASAAAADFDLTLVLITLWFAGFVLSLGVMAWGQHRFTSGLKRNEAAGLHIAHDAHAGPAVIGLFAPRIVVPADFERRYTEAERSLVLAHERAHIRAGDLYVNALAALTQCLMWFNPLAYIARAALRIDQELACDERVMERCANTRRTYAEAMLKAQLPARAAPFACAWPPVGGARLKQRISMLSRPPKAAARRAWGAALCALLVGAGALTAWMLQPPRVSYAQEAPELEDYAPELSAGERLVLALMHGDTGRARALIRAGADVNHWTPGDGTPLIMAARLNDADIARELLAAGADVNKPAQGEGNALIVASAGGHLNIVRLFVEAGADVNAIVVADETPLINAAREGHVEVARYLIAHGADVNLAVDVDSARGFERRSPLSMARRGGHGAMIDLLRDAGARG